MNAGALKGAFDAKIGKVPVVAVGVPLVIAAIVAARFLGKKNASTATTDTSQPAFFAKGVPDTWAAIDPGTGIGHSPDGTITYIPTDGTDPTIPDGSVGKPPAPPVTPTPKPVPPNGLSAHQKHVTHTQHMTHLANQGSKQSTPNHALPTAIPVPLPPPAGKTAPTAHELHTEHVAHLAAVAHNKKG